MVGGRAWQGNTLGLTSNSVGMSVWSSWLPHHREPQLPVCEMGRRRSQEAA